MDCPKQIERLSPWPLRLALLSLFAVCAGCAPTSNELPADVPPSNSAAPATGDGSSPKSAQPAAPAPAPPPAIAVGDDPAASVQQLADAVRGALEKYEKVEKLIYPRGWYRYRPAVLSVTAKLANAEGEQPVAGTIEVTIQPRHTVIRPTQAEAAADQEFHPRSPAPTREDMLNDFSNAELKPTTFVIQYRAEDGVWRRVDWEGKTRQQKGAGWLDRVGAP